MTDKKITQAIMLTGAAARISQEVAMVDLLRSNKGLVISEDNTMLAGFSSGSLNVLAINKCFRKENHIDWDLDYKGETLFGLSNDKVFKKDRDGKISIYDTRPLRKTLNKFLKKGAEIKHVEDLPFMSYVLTYSPFLKRKTMWARNFGTDSQCHLDASDLFMASTAIPIVFPAQKIGDDCKLKERHFPIGHFVDGGTHGCFDRFEETMGEYIKNNTKLENLYVISPMRMDEDDSSLMSMHELEETVWDEIKDSIADFGKEVSFKGFLKFLVRLQAYNKDHNIADNILVSIPFLEKNTGILDFNVEQEAYKQVLNWGNENLDKIAIELDEFISNYVKQ